MRILTSNELKNISGGNTTLANPNACNAAIIGASGIGGLFGGAIGAIGGFFAAGAGAIPGGIVGSALGSTAAGGYAAKNNPACSPGPAPAAPAAPAPASSGKTSDASDSIDGTVVAGESDGGGGGGGGPGFEHAPEEME